MKETFEVLKEELKSKDIQTEDTSFLLNGKEHLATFAVDKKDPGKRPGIIVIPEWWGLNNYVRARAELLAGLGYAALAVDPFGNGEIAHNPVEAMALTKAYYSDPALAKSLVEAAIQKIKKYPQTDPDKLATVGYCFGGYVSLSAGVSGLDLKASVGFHPSLGGVKPDRQVATRFLICHGEDDDFENDNVDAFRDRMDKAHISYLFKSYPASKHAFTNPESTRNGEEFGIPTRYNADADSASWSDMKLFLKNNLN